jgi:hypothetical protein
MRHQNWHPEWGFLAPVPNFIRAVRIVLVATAVGATAGAGVVLSLVDSSANQTSVAARTSARPLQAPSTLVSSQVNPQAAITATSDAPGKATAALSPASGTGPAADLAPVQKKANKKHRVGPRYESRGGLFGLLLGERHHTWGFSGG